MSKDTVLAKIVLKFARQVEILTDRVLNGSIDQEHTIWLYLTDSLELQSGDLEQIVAPEYKCLGLEALN